MAEVGARQTRDRDALREGSDRCDPIGGEVECGRHRGDSHHRDEDRGDGSRESRKHREHEEHADARGQRRGVRLIEPLDEARELVAEAVGVDREPEQLGKLAHGDRHREAVHVPDLHLPREQVGDETELAEPQSDLDETDEDGQQPRERDGLTGIVGDEQRHDRGEDQRRDRRVRAQHEHGRRPEHRVGHETRDRRVQARDGWEACELGVRHALGDEDRREHDAGDDIGSKPRAVVGPKPRQAQR